MAMRTICVMAALFGAVAAASGGDGAVRAFGSAYDVLWAVGDGATILRSDDRGATWRRIDCNVRADFSAVHFIDDKTGYVFGGAPVPGHPGWATRAALLKTVDGGASFRLLPMPRAGALRGGRMEGDRGIAFGRATRIAPSGVWATVAGGRIWTPIRTESAGSLTGGAFLNVNLAYLVGAANRIVSLRRLAEPPVRPQVISSAAALRAADFANKETCWAVGDDGTVLTSRPGSRVWTARSLPLPVGTRRLADFEAVAADGDQAIVAGGLTGKIFRTIDGGRKFQSLDAPSPGPVHALVRLPDGTLLAGGDGGRIWRRAGDAWKLVHGREKVDVLFIAGPGDASLFPALWAHAAAGCDSAVVFAAMPEQPGDASGPGPDGEDFLRAAAASAGAGGATVLRDFLAVAGAPDAGALDEAGVLERWSARLDVPARPEMLRHLAAAIRLYRPAVVAVGPVGPEATGIRAENRLIARLAEEAVDIAADADAATLARSGLPPHRVDRLFTGLEGNDKYTPPWGQAKRPPRQNVVAEFVGWRYPRGSAVSGSMAALRSACLLPWVGPEGRPAKITAYGCSEPLPRQGLFTAGLAEARGGYQSDPPVPESLASGATLRAAVLLKHNIGVTAPAVLDAARAHPQDPLPSDLLVGIITHLLSEGKLAGAADVQRELLALPAAHPLAERLNLTAVVMLASREWTQQHTVYGRARRPTVEQFRLAVKRLAQWHSWVEDEPGLMLLAKAGAAAGDFERAREAYGKLSASPDRTWARLALVELAALSGPARAMAVADGLVAAPAAERMNLDGRLDEKVWSEAQLIPLVAPDGQPGLALARIASSPSHVLLAVRIAAKTVARVEQDAPPGRWELVLAVDADRDTWTQLVYRCNSTAGRSLELLTRLAPPARLPADVVLIQGRADAAGWTLELALPTRLLGTDPARTALVRMQLAVTVTPPGGKPATFYLAPQSDARLLPRRYKLLALPPTPTEKPR